MKNILKISALLLMLGANSAIFSYKIFFHNYSDKDRLVKFDTTSDGGETWTWKVPNLGSINYSARAKITLENPEGKNFYGGADQKQFFGTSFEYPGDANWTVTIK